jgi:hypothetical protein
MAEATHVSRVVRMPAGRPWLSRSMPINAPARVAARSRQTTSEMGKGEFMVNWSPARSFQAGGFHNPVNTRVRVAQEV